MMQEKVEIAHAIGFAKAVIQAFVSEKGTTGRQIEDALSGLDEALRILGVAELTFQEKEQVK